MLNAGYSETKILSRAAFENLLLMRLFMIKPEIAVDWFSDAEKFREKWRPKKIRKSVFASIPEQLAGYENFYSLLCGYTHPSFEGWFELFKREKNNVVIGAKPELNSKYASESIGLICFIALQTIDVYVKLFQKWIDENTLSAANNILMPKVLHIVKRRFQVTMYNRRVS